MIQVRRVTIHGQHWLAVDGFGSWPGDELLLRPGTARSLAYTIEKALAGRPGHLRALAVQLRKGLAELSADAGDSRCQAGS